MSVLATEAIHRIAPICAGDTLDAAVHLKSVYSKTGRSGTMVFVVWAIDFTNQEGESGGDDREVIRVQGREVNGAPQL